MRLKSGLGLFFWNPSMGKTITGRPRVNCFFLLGSDRKKSQVRFDLKVVLKSWDVGILIIETSFHDCLLCAIYWTRCKSTLFQFYFFQGFFQNFAIFSFDSEPLRPKKIKECHDFYILSDFPGIRNLGSFNDLNSLISSKHLLCLNPGTSKIHYFIDFWHPFSWRL